MRRGWRRSREEGTATDGDVEGPKPGPFDFVPRAKYDAWQARSGMSKDVAMKGYIKLVNHLKAAN